MTTAECELSAVRYVKLKISSPGKMTWLSGVSKDLTHEKVMVIAAHELQV
jgi:hypothetical protein